MIEKTWKRIEAWGMQNAPKMLEDLNAGAADKQISALESKLGMKLPAAFRQSLKIYNGESDGWPSKVFADYGAYLGTERIFHEWQQRLAIAGELVNETEKQHLEEQIRQGIIEIIGAVKPNLFCKEWIPIMESNGDVFWALDMNPAEKGTPGQLIEVDWEGCTWKVIADSFERFLDSYAASLEAGNYQIVEGLPTGLS